MKTAIGRICMAVILSLPLVLGSVSVLEAKDTGRYLNVNFVDAHWDMHGSFPTFVLPTASFSYNNLQVYGYEYQWYTQGAEYDASWEPWGEKITVDFGNREKSGYDIPLPIPSPDWPQVLGGKARLDFYLIDHKGNYLHGFGPPEPTPEMYWHPTIASLTFNFQAYEAAGYVYQWYHDGNLLGDTQYVWFGEIKMEGTSLPVIDSRGSSGTYKVEVWLLKSNGHKIPGAYISASFTAF